jgi:hypothetical protein
MGGQVISGPTPDTIGNLSYEVADTEGNTFTIVGTAPVAAAATEAAPVEDPPDAGPDPANPVPPL